MKCVKVSVIIPQYKRSQDLFDLLAALNCQTFQGNNFEVIVVDDNSPQKLTAYINIEDYNFSLILLQNKSNFGPAFSRNKGIKMSKAKILLFTDNDCVPDRNWIKEMYNFLNNTKNNKMVGVSGRVRSFGDDIYNKYYDVRRTLNPRKAHNKGDEVEAIFTANLGMHKKYLTNFGGFDTHLKFAGEDTKLFYQIKSDGYLVLYQPNAIMYHKFRVGLSAMFKTQYGYGKGTAAIQNILPIENVPYKNKRSIFKGLIRELNPLSKYRKYKIEFSSIGISPIKAGIFALTQNLGFFLGYFMNKHKY